MFKVAIVLDEWKLPIFRGMLDAEGYKYEQFDGVIADIIILKVQTDSIAKLKSLAEEMNAEAAKHWKNRRKDDQKP